MIKYIALLRGINVGGHKKILMADLKQLLKKYGFKNITTYIQSGNIIFETAITNKQEIIALIENAIQQKYGFEVPVILKTVEEYKQAVANNPFYKNNEDINTLHLTFLSTLPSNEDKKLTNSYNFAPDKFIILNDYIYLYIAGKYHETKLSNKFFETKLKLQTTTRNWKTVLKLLELSSN